MRYVTFSRGRYAVRVTVPPELRGVVGKRELVEPLGGDKKEAGRKAHGVIAGFLATIEDARAQLEAGKPTLATAAKAHYRAELEADDRERFGPGRQEVQDLNAWSRPIRLRAFACLRPARWKRMRRKPSGVPLNGHAVPVIVPASSTASAALISMRSFIRRLPD
jgi:hypothetical protein